MGAGVGAGVGDESQRVVDDRDIDGCGADHLGGDSGDVHVGGLQHAGLRSLLDERGEDDEQVGLGLLVLCARHGFTGARLRQVDLDAGLLGELFEPGPIPGAKAAGAVDVEGQTRGGVDPSDTTGVDSVAATARRATRNAKRRSRSS